MKWNPKKSRGAVARTFRDAYPEAECAAVTTQDFPPFLL